ncbi:hypothetical protein BGZ99_001190 [Dissophora globulifera]|uniref:Arrestin-like N-terminal domain-containing protein n=1 Tax=Dissophora globulifera TaxID=979702 RepID=A0A9P6RP47_9FUNG|nr:hypothetical protein BGZ99_001190 [Dissophora globulifera]
MAPEKRLKNLELSIPTALKGPNDLPLYINTVDAPTVINGVVHFSSNYDCKGGDIFIHFTAIAEAQWSTRRGKHTVRHHGKQTFADQTLKMTLPHPTEGVVQAGEYGYPFQFPIPAMTMPSSFKGTYAWMTYKVKVSLIRSFPSTNVTREQVLWVTNSVLPPPLPTLPDAPMTRTVFQGILAKTVPYICIIPSETLYMGQPVPVTIKIMPSEFPVLVERAVIKMKQYMQLKVGNADKSIKKEILTVPLDDGWPFADPKGWQRTAVVTMPVAPEIASTLKSPMITMIHTLKLIMQVKTGPHRERKELRVEMPVLITGPRPPSDPYPSFDLNRHMESLKFI